MHKDGILQTLKSKKIIDCTPKEIIEKLSLIYMVIGLRPQHFPTMIEDNMIITFIKKHFGHKRIDELYLAFELAITGELDVEDVKVYDQFTLEYLMRIMNGYKRWLIIKSREIVEEQPVVEIDIPRLTDEDKKNEIEDWKKKKDVNLKLLPMYLFDWMYDYGYIDIDDDQKVEMYARAIKMRENELKREAELFCGDKKAYLNFMRMKVNNFENITREEEVTIDNIFRKLCVFEHLKK
jgi:hypothetical protein